MGKNIGYVAPRLTLRVGVAGDQPGEMEKAEKSPATCQYQDKEALLDDVGEQIRLVLGFLESVTRNIQHENDQQADRSPPFEIASGRAALRVVTNAAGPVERLAAGKALALSSLEKGDSTETPDQLSDVHLILPQCATEQVSSADDDFETLKRGPARTTVIDPGGPDLPNAREQWESAARLMLSHSDVLIAITGRDNGEKEEHPDLVSYRIREAMRRGLVVVKIVPGQGIKYWQVIPGSDYPEEDGKWVTLEVAEDVSANPLTVEVRDRLAPDYILRESPRAVRPGIIHRLFKRLTTSRKQHAQTEHEKPPRQLLEDFQAEKTRRGSFHLGYNLLRWRFIRGQSFPFRVDYGLERQMAGSWSDAFARTEEAEATGSDDFQDYLDNRLRQRWVRADNLAIHYAHRFRGAFVRNFSLATLAVLFALSVLVWPSVAAGLDAISTSSLSSWDPLSVKIFCVLVEIVLIGWIVVTTLRGLEQRWQERWMDYRSLAEALRPVRLALLMGSAPMRPGTNVGATHGEKWVAWYVRASLREIPPPQGRIDKEVLQRVIDVAIDEEVDEQIAYHASTASKLHELDHGLELKGERVLALTLVILVGFLLLFAGYKGFSYLGAEEIAAVFKSGVKLFKPWVTFLAGGLPVIGAALFGIRATGDFRSAMRQSRRMKSSLEYIKERLQEEREDPERRKVRRLLSRLSRILAQDLRVWGQIFSERELTPGF